MDQTQNIYWWEDGPLQGTLFTQFTGWIYYKVILSGFEGTNLLVVLLGCKIRGTICLPLCSNKRMSDIVLLFIQ